MRVFHQLQSRAGLADHRAWTVRLPHGVHVVRLERTGFGDRVLLDEHEVARTSPFTYEGTLRFRIDGARAEIRTMADTARGTLLAELLVEDQPVAPDPAPVRRVREMDLRRIAELLCYGVAIALVLSGVAGDAFTVGMATAVRVAGVLALTLGLRAIDPVALFPAVIEKVAAGQVPMIVAGLELALIAAIARDRFGLRRRIPFLAARRWTTRALGWAVVALACLALLAIA